MRYLELFTDHHIAMLSDWLSEIGSVLVHIYLPHSGGAGESFSVTSLHELRQLVAQQTHPEILILIFRQSAVTQDDLDQSCDLAWVYRNADKMLYLSVSKNR